MNSNFAWIVDDRLKEIKDLCIEAERGLSVSPVMCSMASRKALENAIKWVYGIDNDLKVPYQETLATLLYDYEFRKILDVNLHPRLVYIQKLGNLAVHVKAKITRPEALKSLENLHDFMQWVTYLYCNEFEEHKFDETLEPQSNTNDQLLKELLDKIQERDKTIQELKDQYQAISKSYTADRKQKEDTIPFDVKDISEFKTRKQYIDIDLKIAGWELNNDWLEEVKVTGMNNQTGDGYVDYVLMGKNGKPVGLVEAKRTTRDANVGQQQAKIYADLLEKQYNQRPIIFYSNGFETYMWDDTMYPPRKVSGYYNQEELQMLIDRRTLKKPLTNIYINEEITNRTYQQEAIKSFCEDLSKSQRKGLLVMATGTGKTRTAISLVDVLTRNNWVKNVLFMADRTELVRQAKRNFEKLLPSVSMINLSETKNGAENARIVFSTYQTMMNAIDTVKRSDDDRLFTVGHFDLIIVDEAHRSIYKKYQAIFDYFDGLLLGLTATPRSDIDKNTYRIFDIQDNVPTSSYEYEKAVEEGFLVDYHTIKCSTNFIREGIKYNKLSEEEQEEFEETFSDDENVDEEIPSSAMMKWLFNEQTIDNVLNTLMERGLKVESGDKLGKTIIFAKNHRHAVAIADRFNKLYPQYKGEFARIIDIKTEHHDSLIDDFSQFDKMPQIAISVDMLDTGIDVPEIVNLVFFKDVKSKIKFLQMIGRGTRLCPALFGYMKDKKEFYIFDVCQNFEFFEQNPKGKETPITKSLSQALFELKVDVLKALEDSNFNDINNYKDELIDELSKTIACLNTEKFDVRQKLKYVEKYSSKINWENLSDLGVGEIKDELSFLIMSDDNDEPAKQFDRIMYYIMCSKILDIKYDTEIKKVIYIANKLIPLGTRIPEVGSKLEVLNSLVDESYIAGCTIYDIDKIRNDIRSLMKYLPRKERRIYYTHFDDEIQIVDDDTTRIITEELSDYKKKVNFYLKNHIDNPIIEKIRNNESISPDELNELQNLLFNDLKSNEDEFRSNFNNESLILLVRKTVGLDREALDNLFAQYINENELNVAQTRFINLIKSYIIRNGVIDKTILQDAPFTNYGSLSDLFAGNMNIIQFIVMIIDMINKNGCFHTEESYN